MWYPYCAPMIATPMSALKSEPAFQDPVVHSCEAVHVPYGRGLASEVL